MSRSDTFPLRLLKTEEAAKLVGLSPGRLKSIARTAPDLPIGSWVVAWSMPRKSARMGRQGVEVIDL